MCDSSGTFSTVELANLLMPTFPVTPFFCVSVQHRSSIFTGKQRWTAQYVLVQYRLLTQSVCLCIQCTNDDTSPTVNKEMNNDCVCIIDSVVLMGHWLKIVAFPFPLHQCYDRGQDRSFWVTATFMLYSLVASVMVYISVSLSHSPLYKLEKN